MSDGRAFEPEAFHALCLHAWPLNVRELSKVMAEAEALSRGATTIGLEHLPDAGDGARCSSTPRTNSRTRTSTSSRRRPTDDDTVESDPGMTRAAGAPTRTRSAGPRRRAKS